MDLDRKLFVAIVGLLLGLGVLMVHSASITSWPTQFEQVYVSRHLIFLVAGVLLAMLAAELPERFWHAWAPLIFAGTMLLLIAVLVPGIGTRVKGAQRWIRLAGFSIQPAELMKIALPLMMCYLLTTSDGHWVNRRSWWRGGIVLLLPLAVTLPLVVMQPDLGTAVFLLFGALVVLFAGGWPLRNFLLLSVMVIPLAVGAFSLKPYQRQRILGYLATWSDWETAPYQIKQSLVTLGSGGWFGEGLGKGWQKLSFLPEANTDFVFSVIGEELGLCGTLAVIGLWCGLLLTGLRALRDAHSNFSYLLGFTLLVELCSQALLNISVVLALVPPKGISLPLVSYGGSSLIASLLSVGIILGCLRDSGSNSPPETVENDQLRSKETDLTNQPEIEAASTP